MIFHFKNIKVGDIRYPSTNYSSHTVTYNYFPTPEEVCQRHPRRMIHAG